MSIDSAIVLTHDAILLTHSSKDIDDIRNHLIRIIADLLELVDNEKRKQHIDYFQKKVQPIIEQKERERERLENEIISKGGDIAMIYLLLKK